LICCLNDEPIFVLYLRQSNIAAGLPRQMQKRFFFGMIFADIYFVISLREVHFKDNFLVTR